jgi:hypothetical protein
MFSQTYIFHGFVLKAAAISDSCITFIMFNGDKVAFTHHIQVAVAQSISWETVQWGVASSHRVPRTLQVVLHEKNEIQVPQKSETNSRQKIITNQISWLSLNVHCYDCISFGSTSNVTLHKLFVHALLTMNIARPSRIIIAWFDLEDRVDVAF